MHTSDLYSIFLKHPVITTDSRHCPPGSLFFALKGDKFDGNDYIEQALSKGAAFAVGERCDLSHDNRFIRVDNALESLQDLATYHRKQLNPAVIAITGTNGKTTTKELVATVLSTLYPVLFTRGNLNNHIGVPLTLLGLKPEHRLAVIEMGANHPGEIRELCRIADPDFGLITNVGKAHLEGFGSFEGVVRTKTELYDYIRAKNGTVFVNIDNAILKERSENTHRVFYGTLPEAFVRGRVVVSEPFLKIGLTPPPPKGGVKSPSGDSGVKGLRVKPAKTDSSSEVRIETRLVGDYNFENVLAAICIGVYINDTLGNVETKHALDLLQQAIAGYVPTNNRSQRLETQRNHLIVDAYNANPSSMQVALDNFLASKGSPKMAIIGEMKELGKYAAEEHQKLVDRLRDSALDQVILCGEHFGDVCGISPEWKLFRDTQELTACLQSENFSGYHILIKGSRTNQLEQAVAFL